MKKNSIIKMCLAAVMAALYVGLDFLAVSVSAPFGGTMKISLSGLPVIIVAALFGPVWGAATGFVGALLGQMITYGFTATTILWVLPAVVRGLVFGMLYKKYENFMTTPKLCIITILSSALVTAVNTLALYLDSVIYAYPAVIFGISLINRIIVSILTAIAYTLILPPILNAMKRIIRK